MEQAFSYCGLMCGGCPIYIATQEKDLTLKEKMKIEIAKTCNNLYQTEYSAADIKDCDGCLGNGRLFPSCLDCKIRNCAEIHEVPNCAYCENYTCEILDEFFATNKEAKDRLDFVKSVI